MFTEHDLDQTQNEVVKNSETKSVILAPFNSTKSNLNEMGEPMDEELDEEIRALIETRQIIKYAARVRDINK